MKDLLLSIEFWVAMAAAALLKLRASPRITVFGSIVTITTAVLSALIFTRPVLEWLKLDGEIHTAAVAALVALSAEHIARQLLELKVLDLLKAWRGGGSK